MNDNTMKNGNVVKIDDYYQVNTSNTLRLDPEDKYNVGDIDICNSSSTTDLTGLMFRPPQNQYETESYHDIYTFGPPDIESK
ncbi:MAG: hypothetical protein PUC65_17395 [Clostridiales bacterium]|nr:hypothetical protein [Clostridiales bacterium]